MQFDIMQYSLKVMNLGTELRCLYICEIWQKESHSDTCFHHLVVWELLGLLSLLDICLSDLV